MKTRVHHMLSLVIAILLICPESPWAAIRNPFLMHETESKNLDLSYIEKIRPRPIDFQFRTEDYIPTCLAPSDDANYVASRIFAHSLGSVLGSPKIRNSSIGQVANTLNQSLNSSLQIESANSKIKHKVQFALRAAETKAAINYSGYLQAQLAYQIDRSELGFEMSGHLNQNAKLAFNHKASSGDVRNMLTLQWVF
ncbi:MAG: hypothetical protein IPJ71_14605 [Bdellovibrionales bacterium]|nr:hypothetical protein [Bdellovibrionales bacterium]